MRAKWAAMGLMMFAVLFSAGCGRESTNKNDKTIKFIMSDLGFNREAVAILKAELAQQGFKLDWVIVNDIIQPNILVDNGTVDANSFQHEPYFDQFVLDHQLHNVARAFYTLIAPAGLYSKKYKSLEQIPDGATFGIPVDPANNGRALFMLRDKGLLQLKDGVDVTHAGLKDITANPHGYQFKEVDQLMQQRTIDDVAAGFLFANYAIIIGFDPKHDALAIEDAARLPYRGVVVTRKELLGSPKIAALKKAYASEPLKALYRQKYRGAVRFLDSDSGR